MNEKSRIVAFWIINSERKIGFGKLLQKLLPTNQIDMLQIMVNEGITTKLVIRNLEGDILYNLQILWDRNLEQTELRRAIRIIIGKLNLSIDIEMTVLSIYKKLKDTYDLRNIAVDIIDPAETMSNSEKIKKWSIIKNWNNDNTITKWIRYDDLTPKCKKFNEDWSPYNILKEFELDILRPHIMDENSEPVIEVTIWTPNDINHYRKEIEIERDLGEFRIVKGE